MRKTKISKSLMPIFALSTALMLGSAHANDKVVLCETASDPDYQLISTESGDGAQITFHAKPDFTFLGRNTNYFSEDKCSALVANMVDLFKHHAQKAVNHRPYQQFAKHAPVFMQTALIDATLDQESSLNMQDPQFDILWHGVSYLSAEADGLSSEHALKMMEEGLVYDRHVGLGYSETRLLEVDGKDINFQMGFQYKVVEGAHAQYGPDEALFYNVVRDVIGQALESEVAKDDFDYMTAMYYAPDDFSEKIRRHIARDLYNCAGVLLMDLQIKRNANPLYQHENVVSEDDFDVKSQNLHCML